MNKRILHRAAGFLLAVVLVLGLAVPAFATTRRDAILAQMAANSAAWHTADAEGKKRLEAENRALRAELASLGDDDVSYNPATGVTTVTSKNTGSQVYSNTTVKDMITEAWWSPQQIGLARSPSIAMTRPDSFSPPPTITPR